MILVPAAVVRNIKSAAAEENEKRVTDYDHSGYGEQAKERKMAELGKKEQLDRKSTRLNSSHWS